MPGPDPSDPLTPPPGPDRALRASLSQQGQGLRASVSRWAGLEGVASAMTATRDGIDAVLAGGGLRRTPPGLTAESLLRGAHASAVLAGSVSTTEEVREGRGDDVAAAALGLSVELLGLLPTLRRAPLQVLARLHTVAASRAGAGADAASESGAGADAVGRPRDPAGASRLQELGRLLAAPSTSSPALVVAAVVHAEIAAHQPFGTGDGLVARAAERLVLVARGVDEKSLVVPEAGHLALRAEYESNLRAYRDGGEPGVHAWLLYAAEAYAAGAEASPLAE